MICSNNFMSESGAVVVGVPQGSILFSIRIMISHMMYHFVMLSNMLMILWFLIPIYLFCFGDTSSE